MRFGRMTDGQIFSNRSDVLENEVSYGRIPNASKPRFSASFHKRNKNKEGGGGGKGRGGPDHPNAKTIEQD